MFSRIKFKTEGEYDDSYDYSMSSSEFDQDLNQFMNLLDYTVSSYLSVKNGLVGADSNRDHRTNSGPFDPMSLDSQ